MDREARRLRLGKRRRRVKAAAQEHDRFLRIGHPILRSMRANSLDPASGSVGSRFQTPCPETAASVIVDFSKEGESRVSALSIARHVRTHEGTLNDGSQEGA